MKQRLICLCLVCCLAVLPCLAEGASFAVTQDVWCESAAAALNAMYSEVPTVDRQEGKLLLASDSMGEMTAETDEDGNIRSVSVTASCDLSGDTSTLQTFGIATIMTVFITRTALTDLSQAQAALTEDLFAVTTAIQEMTDEGLAEGSRKVTVGPGVLTLSYSVEDEQDITFNAVYTAE